MMCNLNFIVIINTPISDSYLNQPKHSFLIIHKSVQVTEVCTLFFIEAQQGCSMTDSFFHDAFQKGH